MALGYQQVEGVDFEETFALVAKPTTFRTMLALAQVYKLLIHQLDVDSAFLYAPLDEEVFMKPPPDMKVPPGHCLRLLKSLYGLKQAPRNWHLHFVKFIKSLGFVQSVLDNCLFTMQKDGEMFLITLYVDDILICASSTELLTELKSAFTQNFEMKDLGEVSQYLGMKITREHDTIRVDQTQYTKDILKRFDKLIRENGNRKYDTPMERDLKLTKTEGKDMTLKEAEYAMKFPYQNIVGALLYLSINTRSDIAYAVGVLSRFCKTPNYRACKALIRVLIYLRGTLNVGITFSGSKLDLHAFSDADWAGDLDSRRSTTGYVLYAAGGPISWQSKLQCTVAASTMEAEYMAAFHAIQECVWVKGVLGEIGLFIDPITLYMDSKSAICLAKNPLYHKRSKHIDIKFHWIREKVLGDNAIVHLEHIGTDRMDADIFTKALEYPIFIGHAIRVTGSIENEE